MNKSFWLYGKEKMDKNGFWLYGKEHYENGNYI